jgi:hypothetical protein
MKNFAEEPARNVKRSVFNPFSIVSRKEIEEVVCDDKWSGHLSTPDGPCSAKLQAAETLHPYFFDIFKNFAYATSHRFGCFGS